MAKKLPETIYGVWHTDGDPSDAFLKTETDPAEMVDVNETLVVGVYQFVGYAEIKNTTVTTKDVSVRKLDRKK